jgi:hypothetical protein
MAERFTADVNLTAAEISELCDITSDLIINALNGQQPTTPERVEILKSLFNKAHKAWGQQIIAPEIGNVMESVARTGAPVPPEVTAYVATTEERPVIPLEIPTGPTAQELADSEPCRECGHYHSNEADCPKDSSPCGDPRCCH